jgi:hypothetical protein
MIQEPKATYYHTSSVLKSTLLYTFDEEVDQDHITYVGITYKERSTSPAGVVMRSNICPEAV